MVQIGFYALSIVMLVVLLIVFLNHQNVLKGYIFIIVIWLVYITTLSTTGILIDFGFPPRVPLLVVFPAIFLGVFLSGRSGFRGVLSNTPYYLPILIQSFRIVVELLIFGAYQNGVFPQRVTFEGLNYDILVGISALPMGWLVFKKIISARGLLIWNMVSLSVLSFTAFSFIYSFYFTDYQGTGGAIQFTQFPYVLLASVLLPTAIFLHIFSIRQVQLGERSDHT